MKIGDIRWVELPDVGGREQSGRRPAIILQDDSYAASLPTTIVVPLSAIAALRFPGTAQVKATHSSGLRTDSVALVFQIRAIDRGRIKEAIGEVSILEVAEIQAELAKLFGS